jgi:hypothetical protein
MRWFKNWLIKPSKASPERQRALDLIAAIDAGGVPLNPARVNDIARNLGLQVSTKAKVDDTIVRIRAALTHPESQA